jgi:hypothetical protein
MPTEPSTLPKPFVFVLMPFDQAFDDIYRFGIRGAAEDAGAYAERLDEQIFGEGMLDRIFNQISKADVVVADLTGRNPNVFYEVGYAHALGKIVLLLTQRSDDIPFDLKHHQHTVYAGKIEKLRQELAPKLRWAVGEAARRATGSPSEQLAVRFHNKPLSSNTDVTNASVLSGIVPGDAFSVRLQIRNEGNVLSSAVTHVYLFGERHADIVPAEAQGTRALDSVDAGSHGTEDMLVLQYQLPIAFSALPPGATESAFVRFAFVEGETSCDAPVRLRLHSHAQVYTYVVRLQIEKDLDKYRSIGADEKNAAKQKRLEMKEHKRLTQTSDIAHSSENKAMQSPKSAPAAEPSRPAKKTSKTRIRKARPGLTHDGPG